MTKITLPRATVLSTSDIPCRDTDALSRAYLDSTTTKKHAIEDIIHNDNHVGVD